MLLIEPVPAKFPLYVRQRGIRRFSVAEFHRLRDAGFLDGDVRYELLDGYIIPKMNPKPPHTSTAQKLRKRLDRLLDEGWDVCPEAALTLSASEPVPDLSVARLDTEDAYDDRHPGPADCELVVEVSATTLESDRTEMLRLYARDRIPIYWIVNLVERVIEVH